MSKPFSVLRDKMSPESLARAKELAAKLNGQMEHDPWIPVKYAPKDGTRVDLWADRWGIRYTDCFWVSDHGWVYNGGLLYGITHFMYIPKGPKV